MHADAVAAALGRMKGFGRTSGISFRIDAPAKTDPDTGEVAAAEVDEASLPATSELSLAPMSSVQLVDLDAPPGEDPHVPCRAAYQDDRLNGSTRRPALVVLPARGVVLKEGHAPDAVMTAALQDFVKQTIAPYKYPRAIEYLSALPRSEVGKLQRYKLRHATPNAGVR